MKLFRTVLLGVATLGLAACDSSDPVQFVPEAPIATGKLQVLHASPDAPAVNVLVNGSETLSAVDYKSGSARLDLEVGTYEIQIDALLPNGTATVIGPLDLTINADTTYSAIAVGKVADGSLAPLVLTQPSTDVAAGSARAFVVHAAPDAPAVDVFVTTPGADLSATAPLGSFAFQESLGPVEVAAGDYQIRVTPAGDATAVLFDSGTVTLADGADLLLSAVANTGPGSSPISLALLDGTQSGEIFDAATPARLRVVHASPDAPNVDVIANDSITLVSDLPFPSSSGFLSVDPATYNVKVTAAGNASAVVIDADLTLEAGVSYDVLAIDNLASIQALIAADDPRPIATAAKLRIVHASPTAQDVDIYVTAPGAGIADATPVLSSIPFGANTGFLGLDAGSYDVTVTPAGTKDAAIGPATITIDAGSIYTAIARDADGGGAPLNLILLDGFSN